MNNKPGDFFYKPGWKEINAKYICMDILKTLQRMSVILVSIDGDNTL